MVHERGTQHMWLIGAGVLLALVLGWGIGWALALAAIGCGAMLAAVFWIGRSTARQVSAASTDQNSDSIDSVVHPTSP